MRSFFFGIIFLFTAWVNAVSGQTVTNPIVLAQQSGVCAPFGVATATVTADGTIRATCNEDATAFVPLLGALAPALGAGAAVAVAAALSGVNTTPDTQ